VRRSTHKTLCADALGINRKNIYRQRRQPTKDLALKQQIEAVHHEHPAYGHRQIALHLGIQPQACPAGDGTVQFASSAATIQALHDLFDNASFLSQPPERSEDHHAAPSGVV